MSASTTKSKCPKCGATMIVDASTDHSTCVWCGTSISNELAKESEIPPTAEEVQVERQHIDKEKFDESNPFGRELGEAAAEKTAVPIGTTFSVNSLGKLMLAVIIAPVLALAIYFLMVTLVTLFTFWIMGGNGRWVVSILAGLCAIGLGSYPIWASVAPFVSEQSLVRKVFLVVIRAPAIAVAVLLFYFAFNPALGSLNNDFMLPIRLAAFLPGLIIVISLIERLPNKVMATSTESPDGWAGTMFSMGAKASAFLIGLAAYWLPHLGSIGGCYNNNIGTYAPVAQAIVLVLLGIAGGVRCKYSSLAGGGGFFVGWLSEVIIDLNWTETFHCGHNLLPFEAASALVIVFILSLLGLFVGKLLRRFWHNGLLPTRGHSFANVLIMMSAATALLSSMLLPLEKQVNGHRALSTITRLTQAQVDFKAYHHDAGYACRFSDLSDSFSNSKKWKGKFYEIVDSGCYGYTLWCYKDAPQRNNFAIMAVPFNHVCGNVAYCVRGDGKILSLPYTDISFENISSRAKYDCWTKGKIVTTIPP